MNDIAIKFMFLKYITCHKKCYNIKMNILN